MKNKKRTKTKNSSSVVVVAKKGERQKDRAREMPGKCGRGKIYSC